MNKIIVLAVASVIGSSSVIAAGWVRNENGEEVAPATVEFNGHTYSNRYAGFTRAEIAEKKALHRVAVYRSTGGIVEKPGTQIGAIRIVNASKNVADDIVSKAFDSFCKTFRYDLKVVKGGVVTPNTATDTMKDLKADVAVFIVDGEGKLPLLVAPENRWAIVNATACGTSDRAAKESLRAFAFVAGSATSDYGDTILSVTKPAEFDMIATPELPFDALNRIKKYLKVLGVEPQLMTSYKNACIEGWAAAPTNDVQKAIWDKIHQLPSEPIVIRSDKAKK